jgi:hypothetical protein
MDQVGSTIRDRSYWPIGPKYPVRTSDLLEEWSSGKSGAVTRATLKCVSPSANGSALAFGSDVSTYRVAKRRVLLRHLPERLLPRSIDTRCKG